MHARSWCATFLYWERGLYHRRWWGDGYASKSRKEKDLKHKQLKRVPWKEFTKNLPTISGSLPKMYGALAAAVWCFIAITRFIWLTDDATLLTWLAALIITLVSPFFIMALISVWKITKKDHCNGILEMFVDPKTEDL